MTTDPGTNQLDQNQAQLEGQTPPSDQAGTPDQGGAHAAADPQAHQEAPVAEDGASAAAGDLVEYETTDARDGQKSTRFGLVLETWSEPVKGDDGETRDTQLARVVQLPDAGVVPVADLTTV